MKYVILFFMLVIAPASFANELNGTWKGLGTFKSSSMGLDEMTTFKIKLIQSSTSLITEICWEVEHSSYTANMCSNSEMEIKNGTELWAQNHYLGTISKNFIDIHLSEVDFSIDETIQLKPDGALDYMYKIVEPQSSIEQNAVGLVKL